MANPRPDGEEGRAFDRGFDGHWRRQCRQGLALTPAQRLQWLEQTMDEMGRWVGRARVSRLGPTSRIDLFWGRFFGMDPRLLSTGGITVTEHVGLGAYRGLWSFLHRDRLVISAPPPWVENLRPRVAGLAASSLLEEAVLRRFLGDAVDRCIGPTFHGCLEPNRFRPITHADVRGVGPEAQPEILAFAAECGNDWAVGGLEEAPACRHAVFDRGRIISLAGYRPWSDDAGDICVVTHPDHRGRGAGGGAVSAAVGSALEAGKLLLYQTLEANQPAVRIALRLGFEPYARNISVRLHSSQ
jgi:GNAT superfamily N-acetyltransferase